ncbi:MAG: hypothetical protein RBR52_05405 [Thiomonas sp.]|uniref:hypothetical protein n=1 Tax=Thiomonas sp. TaxID=2047785 RepID=UPI002A36CCB4|nr:hypothetical protein [Thiomonas sp.]MDY0329914.1 hypothetical protein [Thiomonas sp.]
MKTDAEIDTLPEAHAEIVRYVEAGYRITCHPGILPALPIPAAVRSIRKPLPSASKPARSVDNHPIRARSQDRK